MRTQKLCGTCPHPIHGKLKDDPKNIEYKRTRSSIRNLKETCRVFARRLNEIVTVYRVDSAKWNCNKIITVVMCKVKYILFKRL